jgi:hypothetical protein
MYASLVSLFPDANDLLALEVEELASVLLTHLKSYDSGSGDRSVVQNGLISLVNLLKTLNDHPAYPGRQAEVNRALMEAWSWLQSGGFLVRDPDQPANLFFFYPPLIAIST